MTAVDITGQLAGYMAGARDLDLPPHVAQEAKHRILDTLAAMVSGSHLQARGNGDSLRAGAGRDRRGDRADH